MAETFEKISAFNGFQYDSIFFNRKYKALPHSIRVIKIEKNV